MKITPPPQRPAESGSILVYFIFVLVVVSAIASVSTYALSGISLAHRRTDMINATQLAEGGAAMACSELEKAYTNSGAFATALANAGYAKNDALGTGGRTVYERTTTLGYPFTVGTAKVQIWYTNATTPTAAKVVGIAKVGSVSQTNSVQLIMRFGFGAALLSDAPGTSATGIDKATAKLGNVVIDGNNTGTTIVDGGEGWAVLANGRVNIDTTYATVPPSAVSMTNWGRADEVPDYTLEGSTNQLFDFARFIAVADLTPNGPSKSNNNHFSSLTEFKASLATNAPNNPYYGVVVVNISRAEVNAANSEIKIADAPNGINVYGTLVFNFAADVVGADYLKNSATVNINPATNLTTTFNATNPATYSTGYPPSYSNTLATAKNAGPKNPVNINIASKGFDNFKPEDDLPAMMYTIGVFDIHGNANVCGVLYTPSFVEIENKLDNQLQYFKGSIIGGNGILFENKDKKSRSVVSYDYGALDLLATKGTKGKQVSPVFWQ